MVSLDEVHKNNASLKDYGPNLVAVFGTALHPNFRVITFSAVG